MSVEEYRKTREDSDLRLEEQLREKLKTWPGEASQIWRAKLSTAVEMGLLKLETNRQAGEMTLSRQQPWARVRMVVGKTANRRGSREMECHVVEVEPIYMKQEIELDLLLKEALIKIADDGDLIGGCRHFGGKVTGSFEPGKALLVTVWTD
jgi:hypothetical protein